MKRTRAWWGVSAAAIAFAVLAVVVPSQAHAGDYDLWEASGPLTNGRATWSTLGSGDHDSYYVYVATRGPVTFESHVASGFAFTSVRGYRATHEWVVAEDRTESEFEATPVNWVKTVTLDPGIYYVRIWGGYFPGESNHHYWIRATGPGVTTTRPPDVWPQVGGYSTYAARGAAFKSAPIVKPFYEVTGFTRVGSVDRYRFFVTSSCYVWVGSFDLNGYTASGRVYNRSLTALGTPLDPYHPLQRFRLAPGVYYLRWTVDPAGHSAGESAPYGFGVEGAHVTNHPYASMTRPYAPKTAGRGVAFKAYGKISPKHAAGAHSVWVKAYRREGGRYVLKKTYTGTVKDYTSAQSKYVASVVLPSAGTWRIRASHSDSGHLTSYSSYRYLTVP